MSTVNKTRYFKHHRTLFQHRVLAVLLALSFAAVSFNANAENASGLAYGGQINVNILNAGGGLINTGPLPSGPPGPNGVEGMGSDSFGPVMNSVLGVDLPVGLPVLGTTAGVSTGVLSGEVSYDNPANVASATGAVDNTNVGLTLLNLPGLGIVADAIESTSQVTGACGALTPTGSSTLTNAVLTVGVTNVPLAVNPAPNTAIDINALGLAGVTLILNEQTLGGDGITTSSISTNALHLEVDISNLITADIILGHSEAAVTCNTADLSVIKSDSPDPVSVGSPLTYTVQVTNNGPDTATAVTIQDTLPATVTANSITPTGAGSCTAIGVNPIECTWPSIASGVSEQLVVVVTPQVNGAIINSAVTGTDDFDPDNTDNTVTIDTTVIPVVGVADADLSVTKTANPDPATAGQPLIYILTVANAGPDAATNVVLTDTLPAGLGSTAVIFPGLFTCNLAGDVVTCTLASLASGALAQVGIAVTPPNGGVITNTAVTGSGQNDPDPFDNTVTINTTVNPVVGTQDANLSVSKTASPDPATAGQPLVYTLTVANTGPGPATGIVLTDLLPAGLGSTAAITPGPFTCNLAGDTVTCTLASLASGASAQVMITVTPANGGVITNTAVTGSEQNDPDPSDNMATIATQVNPAADLSVTKTANPSPATPGEPLIYTLTVSNAGPDTATNVVLTDALPPGLGSTAVIFPGLFTCNLAGDIVTCTLANLASGALAQVGIAVTPVDVGTIANTLVAVSGAFEPLPSDNTVTIMTPVGVEPIPTLGEWGLALLLGALLILGWWSRPRRRQ